MNDIEKERIRQNVKNLASNVQAVAERAGKSKTKIKTKGVKRSYELGGAKINPPRF